MGEIMWWIAYMDGKGGGVKGDEEVAMAVRSHPL